MDPGASSAGADHFAAILNNRDLISLTSTKEVSIFLTHHHIDHFEGLPVIASVFPHAKVFGHKMTLKRVETELEKVEIDSGYVFDINGIISIADSNTPDFVFRRAGCIEC